MSDAAALGRDLLVAPLMRGDTWSAFDLTAQEGDLGLASGVDALRQALVLRLLTPLGSLAALGHPRYGSRLHELIGTRFTTEARLRARAFVLAALRDEPRVEEVLALAVDPQTPDQPHSLRIQLQLRARGVAQPVGLLLEVAG